jgi:hypothetical protein
MQKPQSIIDADQMSLPASPRWFWVAYLSTALALALGILSALGVAVAWAIDWLIMNSPT